MAPAKTTTAGKKSATGKSKGKPGGQGKSQPNKKQPAASRKKSAKGNSGGGKRNANAGGNDGSDKVQFNEQGYAKEHQNLVFPGRVVAVATAFQNVRGRKDGLFLENSSEQLCFHNKAHYFQKRASTQLCLKTVGYLWTDLD